MYRQGDLVVVEVRKVLGKKLDHLVLAEGEVTGHKHEIVGNAELFEHDGTLYLKVNEMAELTHQEHGTILLPEGGYRVKRQREYVVGDEKYRKVMD